MRCKPKKHERFCQFPMTAALRFYHMLPLDNLAFRKHLAAFSRATVSPICQRRPDQTDNQCHSGFDQPPLDEGPDMEVFPEHRMRARKTVRNGSFQRIRLRRRESGQENSAPSTNPLQRLLTTTSRRVFANRHRGASEFA